MKNFSRFSTINVQGNILEGSQLREEEVFPTCYEHCLLAHVFHVLPLVQEDVVGLEAEVCQNYCQKAGGHEGHEAAAPAQQIYGSPRAHPRAHKLPLLRPQRHWDTESKTCEE